MEIRTQRLLLRPVAETDWQAIREIWARFTASPMAQYDQPHSTQEEDVRRRIARWAGFAGSREHRFFAVCLDGRLIGYVAFNIREQGYEIGYCFHSDFHGKGYAQESIAALLEHLRGQGVSSFRAGTALANTPSVALLERLGFRLTGTEQVSFHRDGNGQPVFFEGGVFERN